MPCLPCFKRKGKEKYTFGDNRASPSKTPPQQPQVSQPSEPEPKRTPSPEKVAPPVATQTEPTPVVEESVQKAETIQVEAAPPVEPAATPTIEPAQKVPEKEPSPERVVFVIPDIPEDLDDKAAFELALTTLAKLYELRPEDLTPEMSQGMEKLVARLEKVADRLEATASGGGGGAASSGSSGDGDPSFVDDFNNFVNGTVADFVKQCTALGGSVQQMGAKVQEGFNACREVVTIAGRNGKPSDALLPDLFKNVSASIAAIQDFREKNRKDKQFNQLSALSEAIPALGWIAVAPKPAPYVSQMEESAQFYTNKVLKEFRESDPKQADWARSLIKLLKELQAYVKAQHTTGLQWNSKKPALAALPSGSGAAAPPPPPPAGGAPPPPPPPAIQPPTDAPAPKANAGSDVRAALFSDLNKGGDVTKGLKKVSDDMKTHKNPALRMGPAPFKPVKAPKPGSPKAAPAAAAKKPPKLELQNKKWVVEFQEGNQNLEIANGQNQQTIYVYKCNNSVLQVKNKVNSITVDGCKKFGLVFDDVISCVEFINCQSVKAQANGACSTFSIDKTDGCQIYLTEKSINAQIITAKSSEMNIAVTKEDGDLDEYALPEQYVSKWNGKSFKTDTMDLNL